MMKREYELKNIQGLRGIAIAMIFVAHTGSFLTQNEQVQKFLSQFGGYGVTLFLTISGLLLADKMQERVYNGTIVEGLKYAWNKIRKLYWLHFLMWIAVMGIDYFAGRDFDAKQIIFSIFNLTLTQDYIPFSGIINSFNGPSWYLSMSTFLWLLTPWFVAKVEKVQLSPPKIVACISGILLLRTIWLTIAKWVIGFIDSHYAWINVSWFADWLTYFCPLLCFGTYILTFFVRKLYKTCKANEKMCMFSIAILIFVCKLCRDFWQSGTFMILAITIIVSFLADDGNKVIDFALQNKPLSNIGNLSSYIFLIHGPVNFALRDFGAAIPVPIKFFVSVLITLLLSIIATRAYKGYVMKKEMK